MTTIVATEERTMAGPQLKPNLKNHLFKCGSQDLSTFVQHLSQGFRIWEINKSVLCPASIGCDHLLAATLYGFRCIDEFLALFFGYFVRNFVNTKSQNLRHIRSLIISWKPFAMFSYLMFIIHMAHTAHIDYDFWMPHVARHHYRVHMRNMLSLWENTNCSF